jgi:hypothetical protein
VSTATPGESPERALEQALAGAGIHATVESRGKLALLAVRDAVALREPAVRAEAVRLARSLGFVQVALELSDSATDSASLLGP